MAGKIRDDGVSVIVGTLLLILITVTAAAGLAVMISTMQKDAMSRQSHITAAQNELIQITGVNFKTNSTDWDTYYWPPNGTLNRTYSSFTFTLTNLNNAEARILGFSVNGKYAHNVTVIPDPSLSKYPVPYDLSDTENSSYISVPASTGEKIRINFTNDFSTPPQNIGQNDQISIQVMTTLYNTFGKTFQPPTPVLQSSTESQNIGPVQREVLVLDGSSSFAAGNSSITDWFWAVQDASNTTTSVDPQGNCTDTMNLSQSMSFRGKVVHYQPRSRGPFCLNLTVQDNAGMMKSSDYTLVPENDQFVPPANLNAISQGSFINVTVIDLNGKPVPNAVVNYVIDTNQFGNLTLSNYIGVTDMTGMNSSNVTSGIGTVRVVYDSFTPIVVSAQGS